jgi:alpha-mannosidase
LNNSDSKLKVVLTSSDQIYKDITPEIRKKLPVYSGDLLLIEHSAGSMTSQSYMKRINRKNELLAQAAEQLASVADYSGSLPYPYTKLNKSWDLVLGSQFHDILPGTSIPKAYEYAWNDELIAANGFAEVLKSSVNVLSQKLNTQGSGRSVVVYNPVSMAREDVVTVEMEYEKLPSAVVVFDGKGKALPTQIIGSEGNKLKFIFLAKVPSVGLAVFDVRESKNKAATSPLTATKNTIENSFYKVVFAENGDVKSIFDKKASKELLSKPARLEFLHEAPAEWPAWNMDWKDRQNPAIDAMDKNATISVLEQGPVRVSLEIKRSGRNSDINQVVSLSAGEAGKRIEVTNKLDWQSRGVSLKASFPLNVSNEMATYNLGVGTIQRNNNNEVKFEVPAKEWFDLTDASGNYGVSILEDCKYGSDKPDNNTLRLTLMYTPEAKWYKYQDSQDWGIHDFKYGIYAHNGSWTEGQTPWQGKFLNQPMLAFETTKHNGQFGKEISMLSASTSQMGVMAYKKMEDNDYYLVRVNELYGKDLKGATLSFPGNVVDAYEVNGQEEKIGPAKFVGNKINVDLTHYTIRSYAVKLESAKGDKMVQTPVTLAFTQDVFSFDNNRSDGMFSRRAGMPAELMTDEVTSEGIHFKMGSRADRENNVIGCKGQEVALPEGDYTTLYILAAAREDTKGTFTVGDHTFDLGIQKWTDFVGQHYNREFAKDGYTVTGIKSPYSKQDNIAWFASHRHTAYPSANDAYQYCYIYKYQVNIPKGAKSVKLPDNDNIKVFAITVAKNTGDNAKVLQPLYDDFKGSKGVSLRNNE